MADNPGMETYGFQIVSDTYEITTRNWEHSVRTVCVARGRGSEAGSYQGRSLSAISPLQNGQ